MRRGNSVPADIRHLRLQPLPNDRRHAFLPAEHVEDTLADRASTFLCPTEARQAPLPILVLGEPEHLSDRAARLAPVRVQEHRQGEQGGKFFCKNFELVLRYALARGRRLYSVQEWYERLETVERLLDCFVGESGALCVRVWSWECFQKLTQSPSICGGRGGGENAGW